MKAIRILWATLSALILAAGPWAGADAAVETPATVTLAPREALDTATTLRLVESALVGAGAEAGARIDIRRPALPLANRSPVPVAVSVVSIEHDARRRLFRAILRVAGEDGRGGDVEVSGLVVPQIEVAVPVRALGAGERVGEGDLRVRRLDRDTLPDGAVLTTADLVGRETRRRIAADRPVLAADLQPILAVRRGETVSVVFVRGGLRMTLMGRALDDAALGEIAHVLNVDSGRTVSGIATDARVVEVDGTLRDGS